VIDTHCHLTFPDFAGRIPEVLAEAREHGVMGAITISTTTQDCLEALSIARRFPNVWCTAGVHPLHADEGPHQWGNLRTVARQEKCVAWGELGLDNHYPDPPRSTQDAVLAEQLALIESCRDVGVPADEPVGAPPGAPDTARRPIDLPIVIHCREAFDDLLPILRSARLDPARFVFHCFTGTPADARKVLDFGAMISFTGVVTYRNAADVQEAARLVPLDRIMVETDAPFLSPEPKRGTRPCAPWMTSLTARRLADLRNEPWPDFQEALNRNTQRYFGISPENTAPDRRG
jgi:TatD DNase family protein